MEFLRRQRDAANPTRLAQLALIALATGILLSVVALGAVRIDDRYRLNHVGSVWITTGLDMADGTLYRPLFDGERFGGSRYMPVPIIVTGGAMSLIDDPLVAAKLVSALTFAGLLVAMAWVLLRSGLPGPVAFALPMLLLVTDVGLNAALGVRNDVLPVILQLVALQIVVRGDARRGSAIAGAVCAVALLSKTTAIWGPAAIVVWLWRRRRRDLVAFLLPLAAAFAVGVTLFQLLSEGRFLENVVGLSGAGVEGTMRSLTETLDAFWESVRVSAPLLLAVALVFVALAAIVRAVRRGTLEVLHLALGLSLLITIVAFADIGIGPNHLIDPLVLLILVAGCEWGSLERRDRRAPKWVAPAAAAVATALLAVGAVAVLLPDLRQARSDFTGGVDHPSVRRVPAEGEIDPGAEVLTDDPWVELSRGRTPVVLDPFMLPRLADEEPGAMDELVVRIQEQEFDVIVLYRPIEAAGDPVVDRQFDASFYERVHFGERLAGAIREAYDFSTSTYGYFIYTPVAGP